MSTGRHTSAPAVVLSTRRKNATDRCAGANLGVILKAKEKMKRPRAPNARQLFPNLTQLVKRKGDYRTSDCRT